MAKFFINRPIFAAVISVIITLAGGIAVVHAAGRAISRNHSADRAGELHLSRRQLQGRGRNGRRADRAAGDRRREHALHELAIAPTTAATT